MNIRNITTLKRAAKDSGVTLPGKPIAASFQARESDHGVFASILPDGSQAVYAYGITSAPRESAHPLNKRARAFRDTDKRIYVEPIAHGTTIESLLNA